MDEKRANLEIIAPTVEEAIERGLEELGLDQEAVDVEILDSGSRGLFGLGSRQARVRLSVKKASDEEGISTKIDLPAEEQFLDEAADLEVEPYEAAQMGPAAPRRGSDNQSDDTLRVTECVVLDLLERMKVRAEVTARFGDTDDERSKSTVWVDVRGRDLSILIGPKAETLNALQFIAGLIASKELGHTIPLIVDVEGYRSRRVQQLRQLARRMAEQAVKTGKRQILEPMAASDRRIIHIELRNHPEVKTESIGEDPRRKVTIIPK